MKAVVEGLLFLSGEDGLTIKEISGIIEKDEIEVKEIIKELYNDYNNSNRGIQIEYLAEHFKLATKVEHKDYYKKLVEDKDDNTLSQSALEVLAVIAYNGPITRIDIDNIRGVNSSYIIRKLLLKGLIEENGRSDIPGKPKLYKVSNNFLDYFGLGNINELPKIEIETTDNNEKNIFESKYEIGRSITIFLPLLFSIFQFIDFMSESTLEEFSQKLPMFNLISSILFTIPLP